LIPFFSAIAHFSQNPIIFIGKYQHPAYPDTDFPLLFKIGILNTCKDIEKALDKGPAKNIFQKLQPP
jgi:hypothetical protein